MKLNVTVKTAKGYYDEAKIEGRTLKECLDKIIPALEAMPEEQEGVKQVDWTYIFIEVQR